jgi:alkanesulfonate monooxygenase SsuD/methylene tetrahydromethanopterin reductase-like flavin-dependent oxidoreductase (luciferase family)
MKFMTITLIANVADPRSGELKSTTERLREVVGNAVLAEELGFDAYGVGERHHVPFLSSSPPVVLSHIAAVTSRIRLFTTTTTLSLLDPVRAAEDYATLDHLSNGRLELIIGKGNGPEQTELYGFSRDGTEQWDRLRENFVLLRRLWSEERVTWSGRFRPSLVDAAVVPRPLQDPLRIWHGSATSEGTVELAADWGDPIFSANVTNPVEPYAALVRHYRQRWEANGRDPADAVVGAGTAGYHARKSSQQAVEEYRPIFLAQTARMRAFGVESPFTSYDDYLERSSALIGSPDQIIEKVHRYHEVLGHTILHLHGDGDGFTPGQHREALELFQSDIAPVLRRDIADPPWPGPAPSVATAAHPSAG